DGSAAAAADFRARPGTRAVDPQGLRRGRGTPAASGRTRSPDACVALCRNNDTPAPRLWRLMLGAAPASRGLLDACTPTLGSALSRVAVQFADVPGTWRNSRRTSPGMRLHERVAKRTLAR